MKIEIDEQEAEQLKFFIGMLIGKEARDNDGYYAYHGGDEFSYFPCLLKNIYDQLNGAKDED